jgi:hypothetical protein
MQNTENEKLAWEAPRLITDSLDKTESGSYAGGPESDHFATSFTHFS